MLNKRMLEKTQEQVAALWAELEELCDKYPDINEFVNYILEYGAESSEYRFSEEEASEDYRVGSELVRLIWEISHSELGILGPPHFDPGWILALLYFIKNYFLDDASFFFIKGAYGRYNAHPGYNEGGGFQDPRLLTTLAKCHAKKSGVILSIRGLKDSVDYSAFEDMLSKKKNKL